MRCGSRKVSGTSSRPITLLPEQRPQGAATSQLVYNPGGIATSTLSLAVAAGPFANRTRISLKRAEHTFCWPRLPLIVLVVTSPNSSSTMTLVAIVDCGSPSAARMSLTFIAPLSWRSCRICSRSGEASARRTSVLSLVVTLKKAPSEAGRAVLSGAAVILVCSTLDPSGFVPARSRLDKVQAGGRFDPKSGVGHLPCTEQPRACWWARQDSNLRQHRYERRVLTTELRARAQAPRRSRRLEAAPAPPRVRRPCAARTIAGPGLRCRGSCAACASARDA